jgi:hypothetical protein
VTPRDTSTGDVLEEMVIPALKRGGYQIGKQVPVGTRPGGGKHKVDVVAGDKSGRAVLISLKWQQTGGTTEQKVPFEVMCLSDALKTYPGRYHAAYIVLGGTGWTLREFYTGDWLGRYMKDAGSVHLLDMETFIAKANRGEL